MSTKILIIWLLAASLIIILSSCAARSGVTIVHTGGKILPDSVMLDGKPCDHLTTTATIEYFEGKYLCAGYREIIIRYGLRPR